MLWHAMPPELNTARLMAGAGPAPMLQAAAGWEALGAALEAQAVELGAALVALKAAWTGPGSERAIAAATPMVAWLNTAAEHAQQRGMRAMAQAASYTKALAMTPSLPEIATNHITHGVLTATNFLGINMVPIGLNETDYFVRMWNQAAVSMDVYLAETMANTTFEPLPPVKPIVQPGVGEVVAAQALARLSSTAADEAAGTLRALAEEVAEDIPSDTPDVPTPDVPTPDATVPPAQQVPQYTGQLGQLGGPMQQLMQPLQQMTSLAGQTGGMGGPGGNLPGAGGAADRAPGQVGLLGASPLSSHPLAGGSGPKAGLGLMHSEALPGAGGTSARTSLMSQLIDKPTAGAMAPAAAGAGAGSSAMGGTAPMGAMGHGAQAGSGSTRPSLAAPATLTAEHHDDDGDDHDDDW
ncbi:PPE family protein [Mycobacterium sp. 4858]|uniref:PPE family protein n=1 Tax=Mycobacterium sp. 4858 TaxID=2057185 RepID=UPI000C850D92|nr:PPE family protein [Mycobacterium sp. 4858]